MWTIILRFMGDLPEPVLFARNHLNGNSVMQQTHNIMGKESNTQSPQHKYAQVHG